MTQPTPSNNIPIHSIERLLYLIKLSNQQIEGKMEAGSDETSLIIRQYQYIKRRYTQELLNLLKEFDLPIKILD